jgi:hypothetical protein
MEQLFGALMPPHRTDEGPLLALKEPKGEHLWR